MKKFISNFHYITHDTNRISHVEQAQMACEAGIKWIQYRSLNKPESDLMAEINQIASICDDWGTTLMVTNHYHIIHKADIQGVHIEDVNANFFEIRKFIGNDKTLGASAFNHEHIKRQYEYGVDYIGCGPFGHTDTKPNSEKHWHFEGYKNAKIYCEMNNIDVPLIAVGGINLHDIPDLLNTGIDGIAVSSAIHNSDHPKEKFKAFYKSLI